MIILSEPIFEIKQETKNGNYAKFIISPLEQGYGHTLGNSLRRVLLSDLPGAAITSFKITGVKHQFATLKGMKEDIVEFALNLKKVRFTYDSDKPVNATLSVKGPGEVKAKDIKVPANVKIANPEMVLALLNKGSKIDARMTIEHGVGYRSAEDFEDAIKKASKILISYFNQIVSPKKVKKETKKEDDSLGPVGKLSVEEISLPTRVANALVKAGYETVEDLVKAKREDLVKVRNLGEKSVKIIDAALAEKDVRLGM
ncbi:MAG: DNA-directed RNA polymerase subunit alpha C-terminal domain-containing protein [Patescibacteria group bacterium]